VDIYPPLANSGVTCATTAPRAMPPLSIVNCKTQELFSEKDIGFRSFIKFLFTLQVFFVKNIALVCLTGPENRRIAVSPVPALPAPSGQYPIVKKIKIFCQTPKNLIFCPHGLQFWVGIDCFREILYGAIKTKSQC
jgi:hypothetical protein